MTPKEKAENLVGQFKMVLMNEDTDCGEEILCSLIAIKNSHITIEEILKSTFVQNNTFNYWSEVKEELNKM